MYESIMENDNIENISLAKLGDFLEESTNDKLIYFGRPTCMYCRKRIIENGKNIADSNFKIFYIDTDLIPKDEKNILEDCGISEVPSFIQLTGNGNFTKVETADFERVVYYE